MKASGKIVVGLVLVVLIAIVVSGPYIAVRQIETAINKRDRVKLEKYVDFPALRNNLKEQLTASLMKEIAQEDDPFAMLGTAFVAPLLDGMLEVLLTPSGLTALLSGNEIDWDEGIEPTDAQVNLRRNSRFTVDGLSTVSLWMKDDEGEEIRLVLSLSGLKWRLSSIIADI